MSKKTLIVAFTLALCLFTYVRSSAGLFGGAAEAPAPLKVKVSLNQDLTEEQLEGLIAALKAKVEAKKARAAT